MDPPLQTLADSILANRCVAFLGPGLSQPAGYLSRTGLLKRAIEIGDFPQSATREILDTLDKTTVDTAIESLVSISSREYVVELVLGIQREVHADNVPGALKSLSEIPFRHCITVATDGLVERAFGARAPVVLSGLPGEVDSSGSLFESNAFVIVQLLGSISRPDSLRLTTGEAAVFVRRDSFFSRAIATILSSASIVFIGTSLAQLDAVLSHISQITDAMQGGTHFAFVEADAANKGVAATRLLRRYGIHLIEFDGPGVLEKTLSALSAITRPQKGSLDLVIPQSAPRLKRVVKSLRLQNVGPFLQLSLNLHPEWTVILGDNGVGKSTILRAIALALRGPEGVPDLNLLRRLLRTGTVSGSIELDIADETDHVDTHRVELQRLTDGSVAAKLSQFSVIEQGRWVVTAFPALRGMSVQRVKGPSSDIRNRVMIEDIDPLITDRADTRLDDLQQWLVNSWVQDRLDLIQTFFTLVNDFFPTSNVTFASVNKNNFDVMIKSVDGEIPLDQLSQGLSSLLSWVGYTLQRMFEVYSAESKPQDSSALVIVDEVDAHLHPEWQRQLVPIVRKHMPNVQIIATTHSPLVVSALEPQNIWTASRDSNGMVQLDRPDEDLRGLRADQVLTSSTFGLPSARSVVFEEKSDQLDVLFLADTLSPSQLAERDKLSAELEMLAPPGATLTQRSAVRAQVEERSAKLDPRNVFAGSETLEALLSDPNPPNAVAGSQEYDALQYGPRDNDHDIDASTSEL